MPARIPAIRQAARDSLCPIADLLADDELDALIGTVIVAMVRVGWRMAAPGGSMMEALAIEAVAPLAGVAAYDLSERP